MSPPTTTICLWLFLCLLFNLHHNTRVYGLETVFHEGVQSSKDFELPDDFYVGKCDPCIPRAEYRIQVIVHGTANDVQWQQAQQAMEQASRDTGVSIDFSLWKDGTEDIAPKMAARIRRATSRTPELRPHALIVTLPSAVVHQAVAQALKAQLPVFGFHTGYEMAQALGVLGFVAQDEELAGRQVAQQLLTLLEEQQFLVANNHNETTAPSFMISEEEPRKVLFINHQDDEFALSERFQGLRAGLLEGSEGNMITTQLTVDPRQVFETVQTLNDDVFLGCPYDAVVLGGPPLVDIAASALRDLGCSGKMILTSFGMSEEIVRAIVNGYIAFTAAPQRYIEAVFVVVMTSMFVTTGKKLSLPKDSKDLYLSGPVIVTRDNLPTDSVETCREQAFPVCDAGGESFSPMVTTNSDNLDLCNDSGCLPRKTVRIGGVLHGVTTDLFWDPVFAAAHQAATDVGITLELERIERQETAAIVFAKMAARIESLCESGVDGIFVTIPGEAVLDAIRLCQSLKIPVISVNAGADLSQELGLLQHVGQMEYTAGYGAALRLADEGIREAYCLNHQVGNIVLDERCRGFGDALAAEYPGVKYHGMVETYDDNEALHNQAVEGGVAEKSPDADQSWEHIGFILGGAGQVNSMLKLLEAHPKATVGTFDLAEIMFEPFNDGRLKFGIDQQPFLQGALPVFLLTYAAYSQQTLMNDVIETGPRFVDSEPTPDEEQCEANLFAICSVLPKEDMKMIHPGLLAIGYIMVALTVISALLCICFVLYYRTKSVLVRISQPPFLITLCVGCIVSIVSIIPMGAQTAYRFERDQISTGELTAVENPDIKAVDAACMMVPWFYSVGFVMVFSSLFGKIWRVQLIYRAGETFRRKKVTFMDIAPYTAVMFVIVFTLLIAWQIAAPFHWERSVALSDSDGYALESNGKCTSDDGWYFWLVILCFQVFCLFYALVLCFQTKHIQDDLSESSNTFLSVVCIFQINVLAMPIAAMVRDDTQVFYFVRACAVFLQNYSVLCLMFIPKLYRICTGNDVPELSRSSRISRSSLRVSFADTAGNCSSPFQTPTEASSRRASIRTTANENNARAALQKDSKESVVSFADDLQLADEMAPASQVNKGDAVKDEEMGSPGSENPTEGTRGDSGFESAKARFSSNESEVTFPETYHEEDTDSTPMQTEAPIEDEADDVQMQSTEFVDATLRLGDVADDVFLSARLGPDELFHDESGLSLPVPVPKETRGEPSPQSAQTGPDDETP